MELFNPDLTPKTYNITGQQFWNLETVYVCRNHKPPYYSDQHPIEVRLS
jgi:hypothetical protein